MDPANRSIDVLSLSEGGYELVSSAEVTGAASSRVLPGFAVEVAAVVPG